MTREATDTLILPIEIAARELDGKLLLSLFALRKGMRVILGPRQAVDVPHFGSAVYLAKNVRRSFILDRPEALGYAIVALDEEGLVRFPDPVQALRLETRALQLPRLLYAWGRDNAQYWKGLACCEGQTILEVGNPRGDLLRPELRAFHAPEVKAIRERMGHFVLLNTNFSIVNHFRKGHTSFRRSSDANRDTFEHAWQGVSQHKRALMEHFLELIDPLARAIHPHRVVVRPHPSEDPAPWIEAASRYPNVVVANNGGVVPWLLASSGLIHNGCTTAIEAAMLGVPSVAYRPVKSPEFDLETANRFSTTAECEPCTVDLAQLMLRQSPAAMPQRDAQALSDLISSATGAFSGERIVASFAAYHDVLAEQRKAPLARRMRATARMIGDTISGCSLERRYNRHIFPSMSPDAVVDRLERLGSTVGNVPPVRIRPVANQVLSLEAA
ncbi:MAG: surface carbohydrate biosynthesis protein [Hyphomicrobiales bacterium]